ncbi:hypothetical protein [Methylobacterium currus]|uniref:hypothetical protein n=1 Tax=Methylobacterium currus TaxID=2051553 RepID=UPI000F51056D|nr:hypothetical protein [Methylobacterium currus]
MNKINIIDLRIDAHEALNEQVDWLFKKMLMKSDDDEYRENNLLDDLCDFWTLIAALGVLSQYKRDRNPKFEQSTEMIQRGLSVALKHLEQDEDEERDRYLKLVRGLAAYGGGYQV